MSDDIQISVGGTKTFSSGYTSQVSIPNGAAAPAIVFDNNTDTGFYRVGDTFVITSPTTSPQDIYKLFHAGKTMKEHANEYLEQISQLPWVRGNQLRAIETFELFRKQLFPETDEK